MPGSLATVSGAIQLSGMGGECCRKVHTKHTKPPHIAGRDGKIVKEHWFRGTHWAHPWYLQ